MGMTDELQNIDKLVFLAFIEHKKDSLGKKQFFSFFHPIQSGPLGDYRAMVFLDFQLVFVKLLPLLLLNPILSEMIVT